MIFKSPAPHLLYRLDDSIHGKIYANIMFNWHWLQGPLLHRATESEQVKSSKQSNQANSCLLCWSLHVSIFRVFKPDCFAACCGHHLHIMDYTTVNKVAASLMSPLYFSDSKHENCTKTMFLIVYELHFDCYLQENEQFCQNSVSNVSVRKQKKQLVAGRKLKMFSHFTT